MEALNLTQENMTEEDQDELDRAAADIRRRREVDENNGIPARLEPPESFYDKFKESTETFYREYYRCWLFYSGSNKNFPHINV